MAAAPRTLLFIQRDALPEDDPPALSGLDGGQVRRILERLRPDAVCVTLKGPSGHALFSSSHGNALAATFNSGEDEDLPSIYRRCTRELGMELHLGYSGLLDRRAGEQRADWLRLDAGYGCYPNRALCPNSSYCDELMLPQLGDLIDRYQPDGIMLLPDHWTVSPCYCSVCLDEYRLLGHETAPRSPRETGWKEWIEFHSVSYERYLGRVGQFVTSRTGDGGFISLNCCDLSQPGGAGGAVSAYWRLNRADEPESAVAAQQLFLSRRGLPHGAISPSSGALLPRPLPGRSRPPASPPELPRSLEALRAEAARSIALGGGWGLQIAAYPDDSLPEKELDVWSELFDWVRRQPADSGVSAAAAAILHDSAAHRRAGNGLFDGGPCLDRIRGADLLLRELQIPHEILNERGLAARLDELTLVVLPEQLALSEELEARLPEWVQAGGSLVATGRLAPRIEQDLPVFALEDLLGVRWSGGKHDEGNILMGNDLFPIPAPVHEVSAGEAEALASLAWRRHEHFPSSSFRPAVTQRQYGLGRAVYVAADLMAAFYRCPHPLLRRLGEKIFNAAHPEPEAISSAPASVAMTIRRSGGNLLIYLRALPDSGPPWGAENAGAADGFTLTVRCHEKPVSVRSQPGGEELEWHWENETVTLSVPAFRGLLLLRAETEREEAAETEE